jgi:hypothetical protein
MALVEGEELPAEAIEYSNQTNQEAEWLGWHYIPNVSGDPSHSTASEAPMSFAIARPETLCGIPVLMAAPGALHPASSFATSSVRIGAPISRNRRCASRSSRS